MEQNFAGEHWKPLLFDFDFVNRTRIEISNFGRLKTFNKISKGGFIKGSMINGYKIIHLKFFKAREEAVQKRLDYLKEQVVQLTVTVNNLETRLGSLTEQDGSYLSCKNELEEIAQLLIKLKESNSKRLKDDLKSRTIYYQALVHRLVAEYFMRQPSSGHTIVAHLDYDKTNNNRHNLKWMTPEENYLHQRFSPNAMASKVYIDGRRKEEARSTKLSVTKVMLLKKLMNEGKPMRLLAKQFRVTETQILRIKRGVNWSEVEAAP